MGRVGWEGWGATCVVLPPCCLSGLFPEVDIKEGVGVSVRGVADGGGDAFARPCPDAGLGPMTVNAFLKG